MTANKYSIAHRVLNSEQSDIITVQEGDLCYENKDELPRKLSDLRYIKVSDLAFILRSLTHLKRSNILKRNHHSVNVLLKYTHKIRLYLLEENFFSSENLSDYVLRPVCNIYLYKFVCSLSFCK